MSDLLRNLALRTIKPEAGPQPRLRTRFEPLSAVFAPVAKEPETIAIERRTHEEVVEIEKHMSASTPPTEHPSKPRKQPEEPKAQTPHPTIRQMEKPQPAETVRVSDLSSRITPPKVKVLAQPATEARAFPVPRNSLQPGKPVESTQKPSIRVDAAVQERPSSVQVTIGRVEVRAMIQATERPSRVATKPGLMSLDEYLSRRAKGGVS